MIIKGYVQQNPVYDMKNSAYSAIQTWNMVA